MVDNTLAARASRWRARAEEIMVRAEAMQDAEAQRMMFELAATYAKLAERVEQDGHPGLRNANIYKVISDMQAQLLKVLPVFISNTCRLRRPAPLAYGFTVQ